MSCQFKFGFASTYSCKHPVFQDHLCVFHLPKLQDAQKLLLNDIQIGEGERIERIFNERFGTLLLSETASSSKAIDFRGFIFPKILFNSAFSKIVDFTGAIFSSEASFRSIEFQHEAKFDLTQFVGDSIFEVAKFRGRGSFSNAIFGIDKSVQMVTFLNARFDSGASFIGSIFNHLAQFSGTSFGKGSPANFYKATFADEAAFHDVVFEDQTIFESATFNRPAGFVRSKFLSQVEFSKSTFKDRADFDQSTFWTAEFSGVAFESDVSFADSQFDSASFARSSFDKTARYEGSVFEGPVDFRDCTFNGLFKCFDSEFKGTADFLLTNFNQEADFRTSTFHEGALFMTANFAKIAKFSNATFNNMVNFSNARFGQEVEFINHSVSSGFNGECDFRDLNFGSDGHLTFRRVNLGNARFTNTDLSAATFSNIQWFRHRHKLAPWTSRPASLWDEFRSPTELKIDDYEAIAENYRQLVLNYEGKRDYETAESFHIGEMEMRRKKKAAGIAWLPLRKLREQVNSYAVYRVSNYYGTSYGLALLTLTILLGLFSLAFLYAGFRTVDEPKRVIEYDVLADASHRTVTRTELVNDFLAAASLSASIVTFQKDRFYEPLEGVSRLLLFLAVIFLTAQGAMALLAVRRRFKR